MNYIQYSIHTCYILPHYRRYIMHGITRTVSVNSEKLKSWQVVLSLLRREYKGTERYIYQFNQEITMSPHQRTALAYSGVGHTFQ
jgi:hypothetical protein